MKSIKPGRGPSMMNGFAGIIVSVFGMRFIASVAVLFVKRVGLLAAVYYVKG